MPVFRHIHDLVHAARTLVKARAFTAVCHRRPELVRSARRERELAIRMAMGASPPVLEVFTPDMWVVLQVVALCCVTSLVLGLVPAIRFSRPAFLAALKNDSAGSGRRVGWLQRLTAAAQAGIAVRSS